LIGTEQFKLNLFQTKFVKYIATLKNSAVMLELKLLDALEELNSVFLKLSF